MRQAKEEEYNRVLYDYYKGLVERNDKIELDECGEDIWTARRKFQELLMEKFK